jgi:hypothetical protein
MKERLIQPGMSAHAYNPSYWGDRDEGGLSFKFNAGKK